MYLRKAFLAGVPLLYSLRFAETANYLHSIMTEDIPAAADSSKTVLVTKQEYDSWERTGNQIDAYAEFCLSCMPTSEVLLSYDRCVFHAAALSIQNKAWLIAAGSGVGKSTHCRGLMERWPDEISIINGDKPVLQASDDGTVMVHPSPWNGKEGWHGASPAPLAGIVLLYRGKGDSIQLISKKEAAGSLFTSIFQSYCSQQIIMKAASMAEKIAVSCPIWRLTSHDPSKSTKLLYECMKEEALHYGL